MTEKLEPSKIELSQEESLPVDEETVSSICEGVNWEGGIKYLNNNSPKETLKQIGHWSTLASEMYKFEPERLENEIEITDSMWGKYFEVINNSIDKLYSSGDYENSNYTSYNIFTLLPLVSLLKKLGPEKFAQNIDLKYGKWDNITDWMGESYGEELFISSYEDVLVILGTERSLTIKPYWKTIRETVNKAKQKDEDSDQYWILLLRAQRIKPQGFPDITVSQEQWEVRRERLENRIASGFFEPLLFMFANALKNKEIKIEKPKDLEIKT